MLLNRISMFLIAFLVVGFVFFAIPDKGFAGSGPPPIGFGCCQFADACDVSGMDQCLSDPGNEGFFPDGRCNTRTGLCSAATRDIPTLSEWGLIAMAGVLGIVGFMIIRRKKAAA